MGITTVAPVAPAASMIKVLDRFRETGLGGGAITSEILSSMGMGYEIARRIIQALRLMEYTDDDGRPTKNFVAFRQASTATHRQVFAGHLYDVYAPVFAVTGKSLAGQSLTDIEDAFRPYSPASLRKRMVTLFLGLCEYAGIETNIPTRKPGPKAGITTKSVNKPVKKIAKRKPDPQIDPPPPVIDDARQRYIGLLIARAEAQDSPDQDLLDRIERALGITGGSS